MFKCTSVETNVVVSTLMEKTRRVIHFRVLYWYSTRLCLLFSLIYLSDYDINYTSVHVIVISLIKKSSSLTLSNRTTSCK